MARYRYATTKLRLAPSGEDPQALYAYLQELREEMLRLREEGGPNGYSLDAWQEYFSEHTRYGRGLGDLPQYSPEEPVRFFARIVFGSDGHAYWTGPTLFELNNGNGRTPKRWWWEHDGHGKLAMNEPLENACGQKHCVRPEHHVLGTPGKKSRYTPEQMLNFLRTLALKLERTPSEQDWKASDPPFSEYTFRHHFGSWTDALRKAGMIPRKQSFSAEQVIEAMWFAHDELGHWPKHDEFLALGEKLRERGLPSTMEAPRRHFGTFTNAREVARRGPNGGSRIRS